MTEAWDFSNQIVTVALIVFYWQLIRIWCQPPPPPDHHEKGAGTKAAISPASSLPSLAAGLTARRPGDAAAPSCPEPNAHDGLAAIGRAQAGFDEDSFLSGAARAYERVVDAYAGDDLDSVAGLLDPTVRGGFEDAIRARKERGERRDFAFVTLKGTEIVDAASTDGTAEITVRFNAEASSATWSADGSLIEGDPERVVLTTDVWTFSRPLAARDPNWTVIATAGE
jgi:predicted lipid-binding transport protein (Tim44 family)